MSWNYSLSQTSAYNAGVSAGKKGMTSGELFCRLFAGSGVNFIHYDKTHSSTSDPYYMHMKNLDMSAVKSITFAVRTSYSDNPGILIGGTEYNSSSANVNTFNSQFTKTFSTSDTNVAFGIRSRGGSDGFARLISYVLR